MKKRNGWKWALGFAILFSFSTVTLLTSNMYDDLIRWPYAAGAATFFWVLTLLLRSNAKKEESAYFARKRAEEAAAQKLAEQQAQEEERRREIAKQEAQKRQEELVQRQAVLASQLDDYLCSIPEADIAMSETPAKKGAVGIIQDLAFSGITSRLTLDKLCDFVAIDVETTGLSPSNSEIIEVAAIRFRGFEPVMKYQTLCKPLRGTTLDSENINGITEEMVEDKPTFQQVAASLQEFIGSDNLLAHNLEFDLKFIVKYGVDVTSENRRYYDTLRIAQRTLKKPDDVDNYKLETLAAYYGIPLFGAHRALADCYAAGRLFESLAKDKLDTV